MKENAATEQAPASGLKRKDVPGPRPMAGDQHVQRQVGPSPAVNGDSTGVDPYTINPVAPYQAVPYGGGITQHLTAPLPVMEPDHSETDEEHKKKINKIIKDYTAKLVERTGYHMGYPYNLDFDFGALEGLKNFSINNLGDPFIESNYGVHSREFEANALLKRREQLPP